MLYLANWQIITWPLDQTKDIQIFYWCQLHLNSRGMPTVLSYLGSSWWFCWFNDDALLCSICDTTTRKLNCQCKPESAVIYPLFPPDIISRMVGKLQIGNVEHDTLL